MSDPLQNSPAGAALDTRAEPAECPVPKPWQRVITRVAQVGFLFFLIKGLLWIAVGAFAWKGLS